ncbi:hypothetical protein EI94DRAFT_1064644 [Lactarius quietus]|nr:hypothetical protein EI94DRAFT_1064644 [Lactarius quietus]
MFQYSSGCAPVQFLPCPETVLTDGLVNVHATVLHSGVHIFPRFAYQNFQMHGDSVLLLTLLKLLGEIMERLVSLLSPKRIQIQHRLNQSVKTSQSRNRIGAQIDLWKHTRFVRSRPIVASQPLSAHPRNPGIYPRFLPKFQPQDILNAHTVVTKLYGVLPQG